MFNLLASATHMFEQLGARKDRAGQAWSDRMLALQQTGITLQYCNHVRPSAHIAHMPASLSLPLPAPQHTALTGTTSMCNTRFRCTFS